MHCIGPPTEVSPLSWKMDKSGMEFRIESVVVHCNLDHRTGKANQHDGLVIRPNKMYNLPHVRSLVTELQSKM